MADPKPILLNHKFGSDDYQGIFFGPLLGSTIAIGAKFYEPQTNDDGHLIRMKGKFYSRTLDGTINFALRDVVSLIRYDQGAHLLDIRINMLQKIDIEFDPVEMAFERAFNMNTEKLVIQINEKHIDNDSADQYNVCKRQINWDRSCKVVLDV